MPKKPLPTGEEPPKGYESLVEIQTSDQERKIDYVFISQLAKVELSEIDAMRKLAFSNVQMPIGLTNTEISFEQELDFLPGTIASDKVLFRAYKAGVLVGYALVVIGWPDQGDWVIQHLVINPNYRLQGVGSAIVRKIEDFAMKSEVESNRIFAIPLESKGVEFWQSHGYRQEGVRRVVDVLGEVRELETYRKEL